MKVTLRHIFISPGHNFFGRHGKDALLNPIEEREKIECVAGCGVKEDRFFNYKPDYKGQITFFDWAVYEKVRDEIAKGNLHPQAFRRNVIVEGLDLNDLIDKRFALEGIELSGSGECRPCYWMDQACAPGTHEFLKGRGGLRARILKSGELHTGNCELTVLGEAS